MREYQSALKDYGMYKKKFKLLPFAIDSKFGIVIKNMNSEINIFYLLEMMRIEIFN